MVWIIHTYAPLNQMRLMDSILVGIIIIIMHNTHSESKSSRILIMNPFTTICLYEMISKAITIRNQILDKNKKIKNCTSLLVCSLVKCIIASI